MLTIKGMLITILIAGLLFIGITEPTLNDFAAIALVFGTIYSFILFMKNMGRFSEMLASIKIGLIVIWEAVNYLAAFAVITLLSKHILLEDPTFNGPEPLAIIVTVTMVSFLLFDRYEMEKDKDVTDK